MSRFIDRIRSSPIAQKVIAFTTATSVVLVICILLLWHSTLFRGQQFQASDDGQLRFVATSWRGSCTLQIYDLSSLSAVDSKLLDSKWSLTPIELDAYALRLPAPRLLAVKVSPSDQFGEILRVEVAHFFVAIGCLLIICAAYFFRVRFTTLMMIATLTALAIILGTAVSIVA